MKRVLASSRIIVKDERTVATGGGSLLFYLPKELRPFVRPGDKVNFQAEMVDGEMRILVVKKIFNFALDDIKKLATVFGLETRYETNFDGTVVFDASSKHISLKYLESRLDNPPNLGRVIISTNVTLEAYGRLAGVKKDLTKRGYDFLVEPEGDLDAINLIEHPENYKLKNQEEAISRLQKVGRKASFVVSIRFDNMHHQIGQIKEAMLQLKEFKRF